MFTQTQVGPQTVSDGSTPVLRSGKGADGIFSELNPAYYEQTYRKNTFYAATQTGQTTTVGLATTYVGLCVSNPVGNTNNLVINKVSWGWSVIAAAVNTIGLAVGYNASTNVTHSTPTATHSTLFGTGPNSTALADTSAALPTAPFYYMFLNDTGTATTNPGGGLIDLAGSLLIPPGAYVCTATTAASSTAAFWASIQWTELPV